MNKPLWRDGRRGGLSLALPVVLAMTAFITWPQALSLPSAFAAHVDSYFSTWRIMWIAHALRTDPTRLFDTNIFHPSTGTLAYSDATLLQGMLAAPLLWAGVNPVLLYNVLLLVGFAGSGLAMFVLARYLTGRLDAGLVAAAVFVMAPYRVEHFMHLEMQWAMWIPLSFWSLHRTIDERSWRFGALSGVFIWLQVLSCVYYGVFLAMAVAVLVVALLIRAPARATGAIGPLALGGVVAGLLTLPYALVYVENARSLGERPLSDLRTFSATAMNYLASPGSNLWWGWTSDLWGSSERRLFPGLVAIVIAAWAFLGRTRRDAWVYLLLALLSMELSFGVNGAVYGWLFEHVQGIRGLRSPARFAIVTQCAIATLAALGTRAVAERLHVDDRQRTLRLGAVLLLLIAVESAQRPMSLVAVERPDTSIRDVYRAIRAQGPGVVLELPVPSLNALPGNDPVVAFRSAAHWYPMVNGYSGYYPQVYAETLHVMETFPDEESMARLQRLEVRYIIVNREWYPPARYTAVVVALANDQRLTPLGVFRTRDGEQSLFQLNRPRQ